MEILHCTKADFDQILTDIADFWGSDRTLVMHHPVYLYEFGNTAYVIREGDKVIAYLFGFLAPIGSTAYVHLIGVRQSHQKKGLGRKLYEHFISFARAQGCTNAKAITTPTNAASIAFHKSIGMELLGTPNENEIPVIKNYSGPGADRVVFHKEI
jgi:GNAT superfamily N-acetyltransferase